MTVWEADPRSAGKEVGESDILWKDIWSMIDYLLVHSVMKESD